MVDRIGARGERTTAQTLALLFGAVFVLVGILGFIPGITSDAPGDFAGENSEGSLFGVFQTGVLHNLVHLLFGLAGLALARTTETARTYLLAGGIVYLALFLLGLLGVMDWLPADDTDDWLHLVLGIGLLGAWWVSREDREADRVDADRRDADRRDVVGSRT
jgi:hypothetical protein